MDGTAYINMGLMPVKVLIPMGFGKDGKGAILRESPTMALGTLAANAGLIMTGGNSIGTDMLERFRILKSKIYAHLEGAIFVSGDGPVALYLVDGDLDLAEFEAGLELAGPDGPNDRVVAEKVERWSMFIGMMNFVEENTAAGSMLNGGLAVEVTPRWTFARAKAWNWIAYNEGQALTTGCILNVRAKHFGVWVT